MGDIDFSKISGWGNMALGAFDEYYGRTVATGDFNGNGYTISNLTINDSVNSDAHGLFYQVVGSVENLNLDNVNIVSNKDYTGALAGNMWNSSSAITNCSASGSVTGNNFTGGLVGWMNGTIKQSYSTGDVKGTTEVGGIAGLNNSGTILNSYSLSNVTGDEQVGGVVGTNGGTVQNSYATGTVISSGADVGGFVGENGNSFILGSVNNCYTSSDMNFYGSNNWSTIENCYGTKAQDGVEQHEAEWFNDGNNLTFLGPEFNTNVIPPDLNDNPRPVPPPPPPPPTTEGIQFQIGANSGKENTLTINTSFSLNGFDADVTTREDALETVDKVDALIGEFSTMRSALGAAQNRLESVMDSLTTKNNNLSASHSTIVDTDFALESANLVKAQILQNATAALLAQANTAPSIALKLLN